MAPRSILLRLARALDGPYPVLPRPLDAASERWSALRPRVRLTVALVAAAALAGGVHARVQAADHRWGGAPVRVLIATEDLPVGAPVTAVRRVPLPPAVVPATAVTDVPAPDATLALALPRGAVLTAAHLDPRGPAAGLDERLRAVPVAVQEGWVVTAGGWVDVWVLGTGDELATLVARARPVLEVRTEGASTTALVGLDGEEEVGAATEGLALGRLLLAHAPAPAPAR
ncbi:MAG TPA: hypothetical protein VM287_00870 [Egibacteraceae bacterium]|nr:hypothetical protein [Egibacteraceae bacterium]